MPGEYHLAQDLTCSGDGIDVFFVSNVDIHLDGHTLTGSGATGINVTSGSNNINIFGPGTITGFQNGIYTFVYYAFNIRIVNVAANVNANCGIVIDGGAAVPTANVTLESNNANGNRYCGIFINSTDGTTVRANQTYGNGLVGINLGSGTINNLVQANKAFGNGTDLEDSNIAPPCLNIWKANQFTTSSGSCMP